MKFGKNSVTAFLILMAMVSNICWAQLVFDGKHGANPVPALWSKEPSAADLRLTLSFTPQVYFSHWPFKLVTKGNWMWGTLLNPAESLFYLQDRLDSFANVILSFQGQGFGIFMDLNIEEPYTSKVAALPKGHNLPGPPYFSSNAPKTAYLYLADENKFLAIGRFPIKWGSSRYPVHVSGVTPVDNLTFGFSFGNLVYTFHAITSFPLLTPEEELIQKKFSDQHTAGKIFAEASKFIFAHRLDFYTAFNDLARLRIGVGELNVVGGKYPDLTDLSPVGIYHNTYGEGYSNVTGGADFELDLAEVMKLYGEFVFDDIVEPGEDPTSYKPPAQAFSVGAEIRLERFKVWLEYSETSEWMYITNYLPYLTISVRKFILQDRPWARYLVDYPLGFLYGPDAKLLSFGLGYSAAKFDVSFEYLKLTKGLVKDNEEVRWKWFWDRWPRNVAEPGAESPEEAGIAMYDMLRFDAKLGNFRLFFETVNFSSYLLGVSLVLKL